MESVKEWLTVVKTDGYGDGSGSGSGYGDGDGYGSGSGYGDGDGSGSGSGYGYGDGYGDGDGYGYGDGSGSGSGYGYGDGSGSGSGSGYGDGYGSGYGYGIKTFCGDAVYLVDDVLTLIDSIRGNYARGRILNSDLTTTPCVVVKQNGLFAHGKTMKEAMSALMDKLFDDMPLEERVERFWAEFKKGVKYSAKLFFDWHHRMTGSCEMGRNQFVKDHGVDLEHDEFTPEEFIAMTRNAYGSSAIRALEEAMNA